MAGTGLDQTHLLSSYALTTRHFQPTNTSPYLRPSHPLFTHLLLIHYSLFTMSPPSTSQPANMSLLSILLTHCSCLLFTHYASCDTTEPAPTSRPALLLTHYSFNAHALLPTHPWATLSWLTSSASPISCLLMCYSLLTCYSPCEIWTGFTWSLLFTHHLPATSSLLIPWSVNTSLLNPSLGRKCYTASSPSLPVYSILTTPSLRPLLTPQLHTTTPALLLLPYSP